MAVALCVLDTRDRREDDVVGVVDEVALLLLALGVVYLTAG